MSLHPYPKGAPIGRQISIPPFDMTSHPFTSLPGTDTNRISAEKCSRSRSYPWSKDIQGSTRLPKHKVDDNASSKTHLVRFMPNVVTSKFKISSVAKPDVGIPDSVQRLLGLSSTKLVFQNPVPRINHGVDNDISTVLLSSYNKQKKQQQNKTKQTNTHTHETQDET